MRSFLSRPVVVLAALLAVFAAVLGSHWLYSAPGTGEFYLSASLAADLGRAFQSVHGIAWWTPNYLQGESLAWIWSSTAGVPMEAGRLFGCGQVIGYKIFNLFYLVGAGLAMYRFMAALTGSARTAFGAGLAYACSPEFGLRMAGVEQIVFTSTYLLLPLIGSGLWKLRHGAASPSPSPSWRPGAVLELALVYALLFLLWAKGAVLFLPVMGGFALWLYFDRAEGRPQFLAALAWSVLLVLVLAGLPTLPLVREQRWMTLFSSDPMAAWQQNFAVKSAFSWWDRGAAVLDPAPGPIFANGDAFYLGLVWSVALGLVLFEFGPLRGWLRTREGTICRLFLALMLLLQWLSYGPSSVWSAQREILLRGGGLPNWSITLLWLALAAQIAAVVKLTSLWSGRRLVRTVVALGYLLIPLFLLVEKIPVYGQLRAPGSFWDVGGTFCFTAAGALALAAVIGRWVPPSRQALAGGVALAVLAADFSIYYRPFWQAPIPHAEQVYADFEASARFLRDDPAPGSVAAFSSRYFYLRLPQLTGRPLHTEAGTAFYQLKWTRQLNDAGQASPQRFQAEMAAAGVGFIVIDRTDPTLAGNFQGLFRNLYPVAFENAGFTVLRCSPPGAPALATGRVEFGPAVDPGQALDGVAQDVWAIAPGLGGAAISDPAGPSAAKSSPLPLLQSRQVDYQTIRVAPTPPGQPWVIVPESYHPDWTAEADGKPLPVYRALGCYLAVHAPHDGAAVTFRFRPPWWYDAAIYVTALGWLLAAGAWGVLRIRERRERREPRS